MPVDPGHHLGGGPGAGQAHALDVQPTVVGRAHRIEHGVVMGQQVVVRQVRSHLDVEVEPKPAPPGDPVEQLRHPLGALVVGRHARAHQPVRGRQLFEDVDPHAKLAEQLVCGVHRGGPGTDDRHGQRSPGPRMDHGCLDDRCQLRRGRQLPLGFGVERGVERHERKLLRLQPGIGRDGPDRTRAHARTAVDARHRVDVEHLGRCEARLVRRRVDAVHRTGVDTGPVAATRLGDHMGHNDLRGGDHVLSLRFAAVAARPAVDPADPPHQLGDRIDQAGVVAEHPDIAEHVAQHLPRLR